MQAKQHQGNVESFAKKYKGQTHGRYKNVLDFLIDEATEKLHTRSLSTGVCSGTTGPREVSWIAERYQQYKTIMDEYGMDYLRTIKAVGSFLLKITLALNFVDISFNLSIIL